jgi:Lrp/AsnC family transcriptional regulator, regulator for asnA, asnC and gidA
VGDDDAASAISLDAIDRTIISLLQEDGRRSHAEMARIVGVSQYTVRTRIERLVDHGIMRVLAVVDPSAAGHGQHLFVGVKVKLGRAAAVCEALKTMHEVSFLAQLIGRYDILIEAFVASTDDVLELLSQRLAEVDDIVSFETFSVLHNHKVNYYNWNLPI